MFPKRSNIAPQRPPGWAWLTEGPEATRLLATVYQPFSTSLSDGERGSPMGTFSRSAANIWRDLLDRTRATGVWSWFYLTGCVGVGVAVIGGTVLVLELSFDQSPSTMSPRTSGEEVESAGPARLPRSRPNDWLTTGSIGSASTSDPAGKGYSIRIEAGHASAEASQDKAILIASSRAECDEVTGSEVAKGAGGSADHLTILIQCGNGTLFYLDEVEIERSDLPAFERAGLRQLSDSSAIRICDEHVRAGLPFPTSLRRDLLSTIVYRGTGGDSVVEFKFNAVNGLGFPLAFQVQCVITGQELARLELTPR